MQQTYRVSLMAIAFSMATLGVSGQTIPDTTGKVYKNIIRYDLSGAALFGIDKHIVFGYERVLTPNQSFSVNIGRAALISSDRGDIKTDSFTFNDDVENKGYKINADYRYYLKKENKYNAPRGVYIGPFISYAHFKRENQWLYNNVNAQGQLVNTELKMSIFTVGAEMGYQFILGKHIALDFVLIGPGFGYYDMDATIKSNLSEDQKQELYDAMKDLITDKFPGLNNILSDKDFDNEGTLRTWNIGFRYIIHIGYFF